MEKGASLQKLLHSFAALADLGQEIADTPDFQEKMRTALHLVQGSLGIMRGALADFDPKSHSLRFVAARGLGPDASEQWELDPSEVAELTTANVLV